MTVNDAETSIPSVVPAEDQRALLDLAVAHAPTIHYVASLQGDQPVKFVSANVEAMTGHRVADLLSDAGHFRAHIHPDDMTALTEKVIQLPDHGRASHEYRFRSSDGEYHWYRDELRLADGGRGTEGCFVGCMIDINAEYQERLQAEQADAEQQRVHSLLHDAVEVLSTGFYLTDENHRIITINSALARQGRHDREWYQGKDLGVLLADAVTHIRTFNGEVVEPNNAWAERITDYMKNPVNGPAEIHLADGGWLMITYHALPEGGHASFAVDVTNLKETQQELRESEQHFRMLVESHPLAVWLVDLESGRILYESPTAAEIAGRERDLDGVHYVQESYADSDQRTKFVEALRRHGELRNYEIEFSKKDGTTFWLSVSSRLINRHGRDLHITSFTDLTERRDRETALRQAHETLEDAIESLSEGFALFDSDDRLVMLNSRYIEFTPGAEKLLKPGATFAELAQAVNEQGVTTAASQELDFWIAHRNQRLAEGKPVLGFEFSNADGRSYSYSHLPTRQGGCVVTKEDVAERKEMEQALRESEQMFRMLVENHPLPVALVEVESGEILYDSPAAKTLTGRDRDTDRTKLAGDHYVNPHDRQEMVAKLRRDGELRNYMTHYRRPDGTAFWMSTNSKLIEWHGREVHIVSMIDLSEEREREKALQQAHETLEDAIESLSEGFALYDADDRLITCNSRYREFNEICSDILVPGMPFRKLVLTSAERNIYSGGMDEVQAWLKEHEANRYASYGGGFEFKQSDGRWLLYSNQPTRQGGMVVTLNDITKRKEMERAIRDSEDSVRTILEASPVPLTMIRADDGQIIFESPVAQTIFRYDASEGHGSVLSRWKNPGERANYLKQLRRTGAVDGLEVERWRADGTTFRGALSSRLINYRGEEVIISSIYDLTDRLAMEEEMARQREVLHQGEKMVALGELLASVAHELNNPLSVVVGQSTLLRETAKDSHVALRAERIEMSANRCARIVKAFLSMARQQPAESVPTSLNELLETALEVTGYGLRASSISVASRLSPDLPMVQVDPDQLTQVFTNLIVNAEIALRESTGKRELTISSGYRRIANEVIIKIKDNGPGIPKKVVGRIFEPFFTTKDIGEGTGIGLAICHRVLSTHGGKIKHEETPGGGATFVLRLPINSDLPARAVETPKTAAGPTDPLKILVIDDEPDVAELISDILAIDGHAIEMAKSGRVALSILERDSFDVILSDIRMPDVDGPELFAILTNSGSDMAARIAFITGDTLSKDVESFLASCGRPYIEKPITPNDVRELVAVVVAATMKH